MLLTGFDASVEQVMYLDKVIVAHGLLQAIARVNRVAGASKEKGVVVDYVGVGHHLKKALDNYDESEQNEVIDVRFPEEELRALRAAEAAILDWLKAHGLTDLTDHDAFFALITLPTAPPSEVPKSDDYARRAMAILAHWHRLLGLLGR